MKIPGCMIDMIAAMNDEEFDFFNIELQKDLIIHANVKRPNERNRHYDFILDKDLKIDHVILELTLPSRGSKLWNDNGYPEQGSTIYYRLDPIMSVLDLYELSIVSTESDMRRLNRMHCTYGHNMLSIEVATKPSIGTSVRITFKGRMKFDEQYKTRV